ncbi:MAG: peptidoglycan editing factor PgeF [Pseudomonadota bacterium]
MTAPPRQVASALSSPHGFFGRQGGVSEGIFASLNGSFASGDDKERVGENRRLMAAALGAETITTARQTHSSNAIFVDRPLDPSALPEADALVTDVPGLAVAVLTADCVPLLFEAPGLVAAVHAGWRGSMRGVIESAADLMDACGADRTAISVAIGPCLRRESFEVRHDLIDEVTEAFPNASKFFTPLNEKQQLYDHVSFVRAQLVDAGLSEGNISDVGGDTLADQRRYFSYRGACAAGEKRFGHNLSAIVRPQ